VQQQQREGERQDPEGPVVHARQRHVRRADLQRHHPVGQADEGRHHAPKIMTSACMVVIWLKNSGLTNCRPGLEQLGADHHRHERRR
jgi:hypothetical protein